MGANDIKHKNRTSKLKAEPFREKLPEGVILPEKLELANKIIKKVKNLEETLLKYNK